MKNSPKKSPPEPVVKIILEADLSTRGKSPDEMMEEVVWALEKAIEKEKRFFEQQAPEGVDGSEATTPADILSLLKDNLKVKDCE